jgi:hypothetical protein
MYERSAKMFALSGCLLAEKFMKLLMIFEISTAMKIKVMGFWVTLVCSSYVAIDIVGYSSLNFVYSEDGGKKFV